MALAVCGDVEPERVAEIAALHTAPEYAAPAVPDYGGIEPLEPRAMRAEKRMDVSEPMFIAAAKLDTALERGDGALRLITVGSLAARCLFGPSSSFYYGLYADGYLRGNFFRDVSPLAGTLLFECGGSSRDPGLVYERLCETLRAASRTASAQRSSKRPAAPTTAPPCAASASPAAFAPPWPAATSADTACTRASTCSAA